MSENKSLVNTTAGQIQAMLKKNQEALIRTLPRGFNYDRMCRSVVNAISTTPAIAKCTPASIFLSTVRAFSMGLEPNGPLGQGYLVPFGNQCQFMPGYRGLIDISRRTGEIALFKAVAVHEKDSFNVNADKYNELHTYDPFSEDRGKIVGYYAVYVLKDGYFDFEPMRLSEIEEIRKRSKCSNNGPWVTDFSEMCKKTVIKRLAKRAPASIELAQAIELDHKAQAGESQDGIIDITGIEVTEEEQAGQDKTYKYSDILNSASDELLELMKKANLKRSGIESLWQKHDGDLFKIEVELNDAIVAQEAANG